jgi:hypothetical protein
MYTSSEIQFATTFMPKSQEEKIQKETNLSPGPITDLVPKFVTSGKSPNNCSELQISTQKTEANYLGSRSKQQFPTEGNQESKSSKISICTPT